MTSSATEIVDAAIDLVRARVARRELFDREGSLPGSRRTAGAFEEADKVVRAAEKRLEAAVGELA